MTGQFGCEACLMPNGDHEHWCPNTDHPSWNSDPEPEARGREEDRTYRDLREDWQGP